MTDDNNGYEAEEITLHISGVNQVFDVKRVTMEKKGND